MNHNRASWETRDLRGVVIGSNAANDAVVLTFSAADSDGRVGHFAKEIRPLPQSGRRKGLTIQRMMTAMHRARLCTTQAASSTPPVIPGQDLNADSGSGSGGGSHLYHATRHHLGVLGVLRKVLDIVAVSTPLLGRHPLGNGCHMSDKLPHTEVTQYLNVLVDLTSFRAVWRRRWRGHRCLI